MNKSQTTLKSLRTVVREQMGKLYRLCETKQHRAWYRQAKAQIEKQLDALPRGIKVKSVGYTKLDLHPVMIITTHTNQKYHLKYDKPQDAGWKYPSLMKANITSSIVRREIPEDAQYHDDNYYADRVATWETMRDGKARIRHWRKHDQLVKAPHRYSR